MSQFDEFSVILRINELKEARHWTTYKLAKEANIPYPALNNILKKPHVPSIPTLYKICAAFGISLSEFFAYCDDSDSKTILQLWSLLDNKSKKYLLTYMKGLAHKPLEIEDENL